MMLQPGDKVWIPATASIVFPSGDVWFTDKGGFNIDCVEESIPDVPNLPAIARYLAQHPETVDALGRVAEYHRSLDFLDDKLDDDATEAGEQLAQWLADYGNARDVLTTVDTAAVIGLAAAMRGEGGHE